MYYPPKGFHTAREYNKLDFVAKKARHRCRASELLSRVTASELFFQDLPLRSKDFQTWCLKALEQQWKRTRHRINRQTTFNKRNLFIWIHHAQKNFLYFPLQNKYFQTYSFKVLGITKKPEQDTVLQPTFNKVNLSTRIHPHRPTKQHPDH